MTSLRRARVLLPVLCNVHNDTVRKWKPWDATEKAVKAAEAGGRKNILSAAHLTILSEAVDKLAGQVGLPSVNYELIFQKIFKKHGVDWKP
eukprot:753257-Amphidinium_carterae.1